MLPTYRVAAMLSMPIGLPSKRAAERDSAASIITLPLQLDLKVGVYYITKSPSILSTIARHTMYIKFAAVHHNNK